LINVPNFMVDAQWNLMAGVHGPSAKVKLWDLKNQELRFEWPLEGQPFVNLSPDGKLLARVVTNYVVALCDTSTGQTVHLLAGSKWRFSGMTFSPDSKILAVGGWDSQIYLWDTSSGQLVSAPLRGHRRGVSPLAFSPDGRTLISRSDDRTVRLWNVETGQEMVVVENTPFAILSPNARYFAHPLLPADLENAAEPPGLLITRLPTAAEAEVRNRAMTQYLNLD